VRRESPRGRDENQFSFFKKKQVPQEAPIEPALAFQGEEIVIDRHPEKISAHRPVRIAEKKKKGCRRFRTLIWEGSNRLTAKGKKEEACRSRRKKKESYY